VTETLTPELEPVSAPRSDRTAALVLAATVVAVTLVTANLSVIGLGELPLLYDYVELPRFVITWAGVLLAATVWCVGAWKRDGTVRFDLTLGLLGGVAGLAAVSTFVSPDPAFSLLGQSERLEGLLTYVGYALLYAIGLQVLGTRDGLRAVSLALVGGALVNALYGLAQFAGFDPASHLVANPGFDLKRAFATFNNPNFLAGLLVLALPFALVLALRASEARAKLGWWAAAAVFGATLLATGTRGAWLGVAVQVVALAIAAHRKAVKPTRIDRVAVLALVVLAVAFAGLSLGRAGETNLIERLTGAAAQASADQRVQIWAAARSAIAERPAFGYGPDAFLAAFRMHRPEAYATQFGDTSTTNNAHSWPLQIAATAGVPVALLFAVAIALALVRSTRAAFRAGPRAEDPLVLAAWLACAGYVVHMIFNVAVLGATTPFWLLLGAVSASGAAVRPLRPGIARIGAVVAGALLVLVVLGSTRLLFADNRFIRSRSEFRAGSAAALDLGVAASSANPLSIKYARSEAQVRAELFYAAVAGGAPPAEQRTRFEAADAAFGRALARHPGDYPALAWRSALLAAGATAFDDPTLAARAQDTAVEARGHDANALEVADLVRGRIDDAAVNAALAVPPLP